MMNEKEKIQDIDASDEDVEREEAREAANASGQTSDGQINTDGQTSDGTVEEGAVEEDAVEEAETVTLETAAEIIARLEAEVAETKATADHYLDQMQRTAAEFQNVRKRQERQLQDSIGRATEGFIRRLLPVLDDFELAFNNVPASLEGEEKAWIEGFERIHQKLSALLADEGVTPIQGEGPFDPNRHEAVTNEPSDDVESGHIIATLRTGYEYRERVLRPALVRVAQ